jgi:hypothetical protein
MSRRLVASLAFVLGLVLSAPAHAARVPVLVIAFNGQPADSTDRQAVLQAFEAALDADSLALEGRDAQGWHAARAVANPFRRVDVAAPEAAWTLDLSVRFPPEARLPKPRPRSGAPAPATRRTTFQASRGLVVVAAVMPPLDGRETVRPLPQRFEMYFPTARTVAVPSAKLPGGAYDFPYADAGRVIAAAALETLLAAKGDLNADQRAALAPAVRMND